MGQVALTLNGHTYRLACADGDEERFDALAAYVKAKIEGLSAEFGQLGEARLILMGAILIADELFEAGGGRQAPNQAPNSADNVVVAADARDASQGQPGVPERRPQASRNAQ